MWIGVIAVLGASIYLLTGNGGGDDARSPTERQMSARHEVLARASAALRLQADDPHVLSSGHTYGYIPALAYADLAAAREQLDLPVDAPLSPAGIDCCSPSRRARCSMFSKTFRAGPNLGQLGNVLEGGLIELAAGTNFALSGPASDEVGPEDVLVVSTRQPFAEIARRLREAGYEQKANGLLVGGEPLPEPDGDVRFASSYEGMPFPVRPGQPAEPVALCLRLALDDGDQLPLARGDVLAEADRDDATVTAEAASRGP